MGGEKEQEKDIEKKREREREREIEREREREEREREREREGELQGTTHWGDTGCGGCRWPLTMWSASRNGFSPKTRV